MAVKRIVFQGEEQFNRYVCSNTVERDSMIVGYGDRVLVLDTQEYFIYDEVRGWIEDKNYAE